MTAVASYKTDVYLSPDNTTFTQVDASEATLNVSREIIDITVLGTSEWRSKLHGIKDWSASFPNLFKSAGVVSNMIINHIFNGTPLYVRIDVDGTSSNRFSGQILAESLEMNFNLSDALKKQPNFQGTGALSATLAT
jgi:predicted secreted protein